MKKISQKISDFLLTTILAIIYVIGFGLYFFYFKVKKMLAKKSTTHWIASRKEEYPDIISHLESLKRQS